MTSRKKSGGYSCSQFVETPPEYIRCGVCKNVLRDPQLTECCGGSVCSPCVEDALKIDGPCPLAECRRPRVKVSFNRKCRNDIDECRVYCNSKRNGCPWVDKLEKLERHLTECEFVEEVCPRNCGEHIQRRRINAHLEVCKRFKIKCNCGKMYERQHQSRHEKVCDLTVVKCPFNIVGCEWEVMNKGLHQHLSDFLPKHYTLVITLNQDIQAKVGETKVLVQQECEQQEGQLNAEIEELSAAIDVARKRIAVLQEALREEGQKVGELQRALDQTKHNVATQVETGDAEIQALQRSFNRLHFDSKVKFFGPPIPRPQPIFSRPQEVLPTTDLLVPPLTFTILDFPEKKKYDAVVYSPPFLTHHGGYSMCLQVYCNGDDRGKGRWLSIYAYIVKGEYDNFLQWPFSGSVTVEIRNLLKNTHNHVKKIVFNGKSDPQCEIRSQVKGDQYFSSNCLGYWNFMYLSVMFSSFSLFPDFQYIRNGCLKIDVSNAKVFT